MNLEQLSGLIVAVITLVSATATALWVAMVVWAIRDSRKRSRNLFSQVMAGLVVGVLNVPGLLVYLILRPQETLAEQYDRALEEEALLQEIEARQVCPGCGHNVKDVWRLCPYCHTRLKKICANCNQLLDLPWSVCPYCEQPQAETPQPSRQRPPYTAPTRMEENIEQRNLEDREY